MSETQVQAQAPSTQTTKPKRQRKQKVPVEPRYDERSLALKGVIDSHITRTNTILGTNYKKNTIKKARKMASKAAGLQIATNSIESFKYFFLRAYEDETKLATAAAFKRTGGRKTQIELIDVMGH